MRISDWSSDVCSSDLRLRRVVAEFQRPDRNQRPGRAIGRLGTRVRRNRILDPRRRFAFIGITIGEIELEILCKLDLQFAKHRPSAPLLPRLLFKGKGRPLNSHRENRSEEHTSELQSLMRISYAV